MAIGPIELEEYHDQRRQLASRPGLLGQRDGLDVPMLVILIGAIGGAMSQGIIGLFIGAVVLALGYELVIAWMASDEPELESAQPAEI